MAVVYVSDIRHMIAISCLLRRYDWRPSAPHSLQPTSPHFLFFIDICVTEFLWNLPRKWDNDRGRESSHSLSLSVCVCVCVLRSGVADVNCTLLNIVVHISCSSWQTAADTDTSTRVIGNYPWFRRFRDMIGHQTTAATSDKPLRMQETRLIIAAE